MSRTKYLEGRAAALRKLAKTIDIRSIRDRVLALAEECMQLARLIETRGPERNARSDTRLRPGGKSSPGRRLSRVAHSS